MVVVSTIDEKTGHTFPLSSSSKEVQNVACQLYEAELRGLSDNDTLELRVSGELDWEPVVERTEELLRFLIGTRPKIVLRTSLRERTKVGRLEFAQSVPTVSLYSGGLDSGAFAVHLAREEPHSVLSHTETSFPIYGKARKFFSNFVGGGVGLVVSRIKSDVAQWGMINTRGMVFLSNALAIAHELEAQRVVVPENGPMMLNPPVSSQAQSSKTANPEMIALWTDIVNEVLGARIVIETPYAESTKAEIIQGLRDPEAIAQTYSCFSSQGQGRMCGLCLACFVRITSCFASGLPEDIGRTYSHNPFSEILSSLGIRNQDKLMLLRDALEFWASLADPNTEEVRYRREKAERTVAKWPVMRRHGLDILLGVREYLESGGACSGDAGALGLELLERAQPSLLDERKAELRTV